MPTGYTYPVADGTTDFRTFALSCARAFGAVVHQRDEPNDELPKHRKPTGYHATALREAERELARFEAMGVAEAVPLMDQEHADAVAYAEKYATEKADKRRRYDAMLTAVEAWSEPTPDHAELKKFMADQLRQSIEFDCGGNYSPSIPARVTPEEWIAAKRAEAERKVKYNTDEQAKELARCAEVNAWIDALYASLTPVNA